MNFRRLSEEREILNLDARAALSCKTKGRERIEEGCNLRTDFQRDRDRIVHSKSFRRLKHKTQVFIAPSGDHYRTRLTHALEVSQISRTIGRALRLNEDLIEAIALGHDVGHTPFGHSGEQALRELIGHFEHNEQSLRVVRYLEKQGQGLNLTWEVRDGILNHTGSCDPETLEGQIVKICDRIGYLCHDIDDALRAGILEKSLIPKQIYQVLGNTPSEMITTMVSDLILASTDSPEIVMSAGVKEAMDNLRSFMFKTVYHCEELQKERDKARHVVQELFRLYCSYPEKLPIEHFQRIEEAGKEQTVIDFVASMTDTYAINQFEEHFFPRGFKR